MATIPDDEDTVEAHALTTSLDPYGQLVRMLTPRALCIAIYDRMGMPLWLSDGCDGPDLQQLVEESLDAARNDRSLPDERDGFARSWDGETAYVFLLRDGAALLGALAVSCQDASNGSRPFSLVRGLLRPALQVLGRELANHHNPADLRRELAPPDGDLEWLLDDNVGAHEADADDFERLLSACVSHLSCAFGVLLLPDKQIALVHHVDRSAHDRQALEQMQRHLFAWVQVQRRTLMLNKAPPGGPLGALPYRILACPIRQGAQHVQGVLALFRPMEAAEFVIRQSRIVEMLTRRIAGVLLNAYDPTTSLLSRPAFEQRALTSLAAAGADARCCVAYADVDRLHAVNENHGMHVGDEAIACIAETIRANLPPGVAAARISGDRFALFFPQTSVDAARAMLQSLCGKIASSGFGHEGRAIALSASFGLAAVPNTRLPLSHALAVAEVACKAAKERGRGCVEAHEEAGGVAVVRPNEDAAIVDVVRAAVANDRFRMEAQPITRLGSGAATRRFELLLRMIDASGESIAPDKFLSAAERARLATGIDRWVVQYALEILSSAAPALGALGAHFTINIGGQSLGDEAFADFLEGKLREYALPADLLSFEMAETAAVANIVSAEALIRRLQDLGHAIALDDFGRGLSSLSYLKSLPASHLKIDGALVRDLAGAGRSRAMVSAIVELAHTTGLQTTAECVESEALLAAVGELGVDYAQGFAIGRPRPLELVLQELLRSAAGAARTSGSSRMARLGRLMAG